MASAHLARSGRAKMRPKWAPEGLSGGVWAAWGPLGPLLGCSWVASWRAPGGSWSRLGGSWAAPGALLFELFGPLLKAPLRYCENHENRRQYSTFCCFSRSRAPQNRSKIASKSLPSSSGHLSALPEASWGCLGPLWPCPGAVCVAPGPSLGGSRPVGTYRASRDLHHPKSKNSLAVKS